MPTIVHGFDWPDRVIVGTIGEPGERAFYLQAREGRRVVSVLLEKEQSALLAQKIGEILDELMAAQGNPYSVPAQAPGELVDTEPLEPVDEQFRTSALGLGWDESTAQVIVQAYSSEEVDDEDDDDAGEAEEIVRVRMPVGTARAFVQSTLAVVNAGRPPCPRCGRPLDSDHVCEGPGLL